MTFIPKMMGQEMSLSRRNSPFPPAPQEIVEVEIKDPTPPDFDPLQEVFPRTIRRIDKIGRY
jgi:hypothetical protein